MMISSVMPGLYKTTDRHGVELEDPKDRQLIHYERYGNGGTRNYTAMAQRIDVDLRYQPGNPTGEAYAVPRVLLDNTNGAISVYSDTDSEELLGLVIKGDAVWMNVFPQFFDQSSSDPYLAIAKEHFLERSDLTVVPTSSCRTVLDVVSKVMIKMHCPYLISRFDRRLGKGTIEHCVSVTRELKGLLGSGLYPKFAILPDSIGATFNGERGWGYIVREARPYPLAEDSSERTMIPMFALYGSDVLDPSAPVLITQMIDRAYADTETLLDKKTFAKEFVLTEIIFPLVDFFIVAYREKGILLELHGQNTLVEVDARGLPTRIVHRDLDDAVDIDLRSKRGLGLEGLYKGQYISREDSDKDVGSEQSIVFDKSIGRMNLDKLAESMELHYGISRIEIEEATQIHFESEFPEFREYFPENLSTVYNYSSEMRPGQYNYYDIVPIKDDKARWRPSK